MLPEGGVGELVGVVGRVGTAGGQRELGDGAESFVLEGLQGRGEVGLEAGLLLLWRLWRSDNEVVFREVIEDGGGAGDERVIRGATLGVGERARLGPAGDGGAGGALDAQ